MNKGLILWAALLLSSCTPQQRLAHLQKRHPELFAVDTLWRKDTLITSSVRKDTIMLYHQPDTIFMKNGRLEMKYFYFRDSVFLQGKCLPDTIVRTVPFIIKTTVPSKDNNLWLWMVGVLIVCILIFRKRA